MNLQDGINLTEEKDPSTWGRLIHAIRVYRPVAWLMFLIASLVLFLAWMPSQMRMIIWHGLVARGILSSMLLVFTLLAVSLVWSVGQRVDVWAFLFFNLRGSRPVWLDWTMLGFTQIGSGFAALVISLFLYLTGNIPMNSFIQTTLNLLLPIRRQGIRYCGISILTGLSHTS